MPIRGVIFDLDGTLADTLPDIAAAVNVGLRAFNRPEAPLATVRMWVGEGLPTLCARALAASPGDEHVKRMVQIVTDSYREHRLDQTRPFDGIPDLLDALTARRVQLAILTNKPHAHTVPIADALFSKWSFAAIEGYRVEDRRKPDPRTAWDIVEAMRLPLDHVALVGDSATDMHTAVNAGLLPVGVTWGYRDRDELLAAGAACLLDRPDDLLNLL